MSSRTVWTGYKPFYENALASSDAYNPVQVMGYLPFSKPYSVIRGIGASTEENELTNIGIWTAKIEKDGTLGDTEGPTIFGSGSDFEAQVILPDNYVAVAWGLRTSDGKVINVVIWARKWDSDTQTLGESVNTYYFEGDDDVNMATPVPTDSQQIIVGVGAGVDKSTVNRIAAGYAVLGPSSGSSTVPIVWGAVDEDGNIVSGVNFSAEKKDTGIYELSFENTPDETPVIGLTSGMRSGESDGSDNVFSFDDVSSSGCKVYSVNVGGSKNEAQDEAFSFVAFFGSSDSSIPGLLFGTVNDDGSPIAGSDGWQSARSKKGVYKVVFDSPMDPTPNLIMTSGMRSSEDTGSDDIISYSSASDKGMIVTSLDVGNGSTDHQDEVFSFFAWNSNVLPLDPLAGGDSLFDCHKLSAEKADFAHIRRLGDDESVFYVGEKLGTGHWKVQYNFPTPETPILFSSMVAPDSNGTRLISSYQNVTNESYEVWMVKVGDGKHEPYDGQSTITVVLPDQFPI